MIIDNQYSHHIAPESYRRTAELIPAGQAPQQSATTSQDAKVARVVDRKFGIDLGFFALEFQSREVKPESTNLSRAEVRNYGSSTTPDRRKASHFNEEMHTAVERERLHARPWISSRQSGVCCTPAKAGIKAYNNAGNPAPETTRRLGVV